MLALPNAVIPWLIGIGVANVLALLAFIVAGRLKVRRKIRQNSAISAAILDYFKRSGVTVTVSCVSLNDDKRFTAFVESEPMKRFRLSHIIEMTLREHIVKTCKLELDKIYWRFPIKEKPAEGADKKVASEDEYINEGLVRYKDLPKVDVDEISWEKFQEASVQETDKPVEQNSAS